MVYIVREFRVFPRQQIWCERMKRKGSHLNFKVICSCVSCVKSATRFRQPHSRCWWSLWLTRDWTMEIACWSGYQLTCYVSSSRSWMQPPVWCKLIIGKLATTSPMHLSVFTGCGSQNGYCTRQLFFWRTKHCRRTTLPQFASACRRRAWSTSTPLCRIEPPADSGVQTVNRRRSSVSGRISTVLEQASWQCHVGQFVVGFSAAAETHSVPAVIPKHYHVTFLNCNTHSGPSSGIASSATLKIYWMTDWLIDWRLMSDRAMCFRQALDTGGSSALLLHQPGMSDGRQHGRQTGDANRWRTTHSSFFVSIFVLCSFQKSYVLIFMLSAK